MHKSTCLPCWCLATLILFWVLPKGALFAQSASFSRTAGGFTGLKFRSVGPDVFSGRVVDLEVNPDTPTHFLVAFATGGLWETRNNGRSFVPLFEGVTPGSLGDIAVDWATRRILVGTGENNSSRSSYAGDGLYSSADWGKTWKQLGLQDSRHISRIVLHPTDPQQLVVAVLGGLYAGGGQRGVFSTRDGGATWQNVLASEDYVGAVDLLRDPRDPNTLYAATWDRERHAWDFREAGPGSGLYRSKDGGATWQQIGTGFPIGTTVGRIGLSAADSAGRTILYAVLDNQARQAPKAGAPKLTLMTLGDMTADVFAQADSSELDKLLRDNGFPMRRYPLDSLRKAAKAGRFSPKTLSDYLLDANAQLFATPVVGAEVYRSDNGGANWQRTHSEPLDDVFYSYGYYFAQVRVHPRRPSEVYILGVPALRSVNAGRDWTALNSDNAHSDHHALWLNPKDHRHLVLGNDGGVNISYDQGRTSARIAGPPAGQFYAVAVDNATPYRVYGGTQDNGVWRGPNRYSPDASWEMYGEGAYKTLLGGDGMQVAIDPRDNETVYTGYQFGNYVRIDPNGESEDVQPKHKLGERPLRFNWQTPIWLSVHNADVFYIGSNKFHRSLDQGKTYSLESADLTHGGKAGDVPYGTLTTIHESPKRFGLLYVGSDDGRVHTSSDGGYSWTDISAGLPVGKWVSRVQASAHQLDRVYVSLNGYRDDDTQAYLFVSNDRGQHWQSIGTGLPAEPVNDVLEDTKRPELLYVGTDGGAYLSVDSGATWIVFGDLPRVAVHDLCLQEREQDLLVGTHGRSLFITNVGAVRTLADSIGSRSLFVYTPAPIEVSRQWGESWSRWAQPDTPSLSLTIYIAEAGPVRLRVLDKAGRVLRDSEQVLPKGLSALTMPLVVEDKLLDEKNKAFYPTATDGRRFLIVGDYTIEVSPVRQKEDKKLKPERVMLRLLKAKN